MTGARKASAKAKRKPPKPGASSKAQHARFVKAARELGIDETGAEMEKAFRKIVLPRLPTKKG